MGVDIQTYRAKIGTYRHCCGTDVVTVTLVINFSQCLRSIGSVVFIGILLMMAGIEPNPGPRKFDSSTQQSDDIVECSNVPSIEMGTKPGEMDFEYTPSKKIKVTGLPQNVDEDLLAMFFEDEEKQGGGQVANVVIDVEGSYAIVEFAEALAVQRVMEKKPISLFGTLVNIEEFYEAAGSDKATNGVGKSEEGEMDFECTPSKKIKVTGLPQNVDEDLLAMFFEDEEKQGGGQVANVVIDVEGSYAIVEFEEDLAVQRVMEKKPISLFGILVNIEVFYAGKAADITKPTKLRVTGLPEKINNEILKMVFENEKRQGGGKVKKVDIDDETSTAIIEFEEAAAVEVIMQKQPIVILRKEVKLDVISGGHTPSTLQKLTTIKVSGLPKEAENESLLMFFENKRRQGGGKVTEVRINETEGSALVTFEEEDAVDIVLKKQPIKFGGCEIKVEKFVPSVYSSSEVETTKLFVEGIPDNVTEETLTMFFENEKRQGGGKVNDVTIDAAQRRAVIEFENPEAVEKVLQKRPIVISGTEVKVVTFDRTLLNTKDNTKIVVSGLPQSISTEFLMMFFENQRYGGGPVKHVELSADETNAVVEFEDTGAVENVMRKQPVKIQGKEVQISIFVPKPERATIENAKLKVSKLPEQVSQDFLVLFFENEKRQGGGKVKSVEINEVKHFAIVEFEETEAVEAVLRKRPIVIENKEVVVEVYCPSKGSTKLHVTCLPHSATEEFLIMFFENEKRQGGGKVEHVELDSINHSAIVEFEEQEAISKVLEKRPIILSGQEVSVDVWDEDDEPKTILVRGLPSDISEDFLVMFFENENRQGGGSVKAVEINSYRRHAIIEFETSESLKKVLDKRPIKMSGKECNVSVFNGSNTVEVRGFQSDQFAVTKVLQYFENSSLSGGDSVATIRTNRLSGSVLLSFPSHEVVKRLCARKHHQINQILLSVHTYIHTSNDQGFEDIYVRGTDQSYSPLQIESEQSKLQVPTAVDEFSDNEQLYQESHLQDLSDQTRADSQILEYDTPQMKESMQFEQILKKLGLADKYPSKLSINDVIAVSPNEEIENDKQSVPFIEIPWIMLRRLICAHSEARDITTTNDKYEGKQTDFDSAVSFISDVPDESDNFSPLDIFLVVFQCCDPLLKQILFQKLYLCKMAVPFVYKTWNNRKSHPVVSVWPLRYLALENKVLATEGNFKNKEVDILELSTKVMAFARFGRPRYSKSKLLNSLLTSQGCKTFFNIDCPSGMTPRRLSNGQIEMFWLPVVGDKRDKFQDAMTFLNMRGDLIQHFTADIYDFISKFADALTIVADLHSIQRQSSEIKRILLHYSSVILIIANPLKPEDVQSIQNFQKDVTSTKSEINLRILSTHRGTVEQNVVDMVSSLSKHIDGQLKSNKLRSIQRRLTDSINAVIQTDEEEPDCQHGKQNAEELLKRMKLEGKPERWKQHLTPVHCKYSQDLGKLKKKRERQKGLIEGENIEREMTEIRRNQTKAITESVRHFIRILTNNSGSYIKLKLILGWLHFFIEREKRKILPKLMHCNRLAWEKLKTLKNNKEVNSDDIERQEKVITQLETEIDEASFSVEHFFREIGHIYEAIIELDYDASDFGLPPLSTTANVVGHLVADGHQLELIDGESFYMPFKWTQNVLQHVDTFIKSSKVMTLSVLGLQSSGKSTLLNTMFGSQFSTRTGRCTRGIHIQLVPTKVSSHEKTTKSPFNYVLVVDTEGLRSPELSHVQHEHDNELATVITGLGDITMLNIMGENTSEIRDILQVIVHAFLRLKMTNRNLDTRKCCTFIHQNVTDTSASDNMIAGLSKLMQTLDAMTEESAKSEGILDITTFNQVIEFDITSQVWYLKNLWQGNPPMARVNTEYSERIVEMKCKLLRKALNMKDRSYKSLSDILEQAHNLWKGVLNEDFVFSFRNSIEIRAYMDMEMVVQDQLWQLESFTREKLVDKSQSQFAECDRKDVLRHVADKVVEELYDLLAEEKIRTEQVIARYFERNKYKDIIIQWKATQHGRVDSLCLKLERTIKEQVEKTYMKRSVEILTVASHEKHEEELRLRSMDVANANKGRKLTKSQIDDLFADIWKSFIKKIDTTSYSSDANRKSMKAICIECLKNICKKNIAILKEFLRKSSQLTPIQNLTKLAGSFEATGIDEKEDISLSLWQKGSELLKFSDVVQHITTRVHQIFENVDEKIDTLCRLNDEITEMHVNKILHDLGKSIHEMLTGKGTYDFKPTFKVKIYIHVSRYAQVIFDRHNENYFRTQGVAVRLEQYRQQQKITFEAHLSSRASEDIVAQLLSNVVEAFAKEWAIANISNKITDDLHSHLPAVKNRVIIEICSTLVDKDDFKAFVRYLLTPKEYATQWILEKSNKRLFDKKSGMYYTIAKSLVTGVFKKAETCLIKLRNTFTKTSSPSRNNWVDEFISLSKEVQLSIPVESFRNVRKESAVVKNVEYLTDATIANMIQSKENLITEFMSVNEFTVQWTNSDPIELVTKKIWGCPEKCPFCGEPCAKNEDHDGDEHYSIQHRPSCCIGVYQYDRVGDTNKACLEACNFDINSDGKHTCGVFQFACNREQEQPCSEGKHSYRNYKSYYPTWDIPPSSNMHDASKFWMWFVHTYRTKLCKYYRYKLDHIQPSWKQITKKQAKESLQKTYSAVKK